MLFASLFFCLFALREYYLWTTIQAFEATFVFLFSRSLPLLFLPGPLYFSPYPLFRHILIPFNRFTYFTPAGADRVCVDTASVEGLPKHNIKCMYSTQRRNVERTKNCLRETLLRPGANIRWQIGWRKYDRRITTQHLPSVR